jgi:amino acid transporter
VIYVGIFSTLALFVFLLIALSFFILFILPRLEKAPVKTFGRVMVLFIWATISLLILLTIFIFMRLGKMEKHTTHSTMMNAAVQRAI